jgi:signal transduction histidine kinase
MSELIEESARRLSETHKVPHTVEVSADAATLQVDPDRIRQVLLNLLLNASQVSADGTPIEVRGSAGNSSYEIAIADRGPGIDPRNIERVFEPFFSQRGGGTGLGLAVCRGIVDAHGGTIEVHARSGGGTTFTVRLPNTPADTRLTS